MQHIIRMPFLSVFAELFFCHNPRFFSFFLVFTFQINLYAGIGEDIESITGSPVRIVWARSVTGIAESDVETANYALMGFDSRFGEIRKIADGPISCANPWITSDGSGVIYSDWPGNAVWFTGWDGLGTKKLVDGFGLCLWNDPVTNIEWLYFSDKAYGNRIDRCRIDSTAMRELVWNKSAVSIRFRVSENGRFGGGEFPWAKAGVVSLPNGEFFEYGSGCNSMISPDNSGHFFHMIGTHKEISMYDSGGINSRMIQLDNAPDVNGRQVWIPKWSNNQRYITMAAPGGPDGSHHDIYFGEFDSSFTKIQKWVRITDNPDTTDIYAYAWIGREDEVLFLPAGLEFRIEQNGSGPTVKTVSVKSALVFPPDLSAKSDASWLSVKTTSVNDSLSIENKITPAGLESGIYSAVVTLSGSGQRPSSYRVILRIDGAPRLEKLVIVPSDISLYGADSVNFQATGHDQFGNFFATGVTWSVAGGGTVDQNGLFITDGSPAYVTVTAFSESDPSVYKTAGVSIYDKMAVLKPSADDVFEINSTMCVEWFADTVSIRGVTVSLSVDSGFVWHDLGTVTTSDSMWGAYCFAIPESLGVSNERISTVSGVCRLRICKYPDDPPYAFSRGEFAIRQKTAINQEFSIDGILKTPVFRMMSGRGFEIYMPLKGSYTVSLFDMKGRLLFRKHGVGPDKFTAAKMNSFSGACLLRATTTESTVEKRFVFFQ